MRTVLVLLTSVMLSLPAFADITPPGNDDLCEQNPGNPHCHDDGGNGGNGGGGGSSTVNIDISGSVDVDNSNTNTLDNSNTTTIGDTTATGGDATATGGSINIYGGGEEGGDAPFSNSNEVDNSSNSTSTATTGDNTNLNTNIAGGGQGGEGGSAVIEEGANTNNNTNTATGGEGGNATIEGGAVVVENNVTIEGGESIPTANNQTVEGDTVDVDVDARTINEAARIPVNSAPTTFSGICNSGAAGTGSKLSLSFAVTSDVCMHLMMADAAMARGDMEMVDEFIERAARAARWKGRVGLFRSIITIGIL